MLWTWDFCSVCYQMCSEYEAISKLIGLRHNQLTDICGKLWKLGVTRLHPHEVTFLREYEDVLQPLSQSNDLLHGEKRCYLGFLIPTILSLKSKLSDKLPQVSYTANIEALTIAWCNTQQPYNKNGNNTNAEISLVLASSREERRYVQNTGSGGNIFGIQGALCRWDTKISSARGR